MHVLTRVAPFQPRPREFDATNDGGPSSRARCLKPLALQHDQINLTNGVISALKLVAGLACMMPAPVMAAGFAVGEQGSAALGTAGAATAVVDTPDAGFYNPSLYALREGLSASAGLALLSPSFTHTTPDGTETESKSALETPPYAYVGYGANIGNVRLGANVAFHIPFGAGLSWPIDWPGQYEVTRIDLRVYEINTNASVGYQSGGLKAAISLGPRYVLSTVALARQIDAVDIEGSVELSGEDQAIGFQAAAFLQFGAMSIGVNYRSAVDITYRGAADFENIPLELSARTPDQAVTTQVTLPTRVAVGWAFDHGDGTASADLEWFDWSSFKTFGIDFSNPETPDVNESRRWTNTLAVRAGYAYRGVVPGLALRAGFAWDPTPSPTDTLSPTLPDSSRFVGTLGAGYTLEFGLGFQLSYARVLVTETTATGDDVFPGSYQGDANIVSLGVSYDM